MAFYRADGRAANRRSEVIMPVGAIIALVIVFVLIAAAAALGGTLALRELALRRQFGPEYSRLVREVGMRRAQAELAERRRRVAELGLRPLSAEQRARYSGEWTAAQERFLDSPAQATETGAALVTMVATDRGYRVDDPAQLMKDLSVHHARPLEGYRRARRTTEQAATAATEELRQAMLGYRGLFRDLLAATYADTAQALAPPGATVPGSTGRASLPSGGSVIRGTVLGRTKAGRPQASPAKPARATRPASAGSSVSAAKPTSTASEE
jgi:hypothetical protein